MKKWLITLGIATVITVAGCSNEEDSNNGDSNDNDSTEETASEDTSANKEILNVQQDMATTFRPEQSQIADFEAAVGAEEPDEDTIRDAGEAAKSAASDAAAKVEEYEIEADLSDDIIEQYEEALPSLKSYFEEVESALDESLTDADLTSANEEFEKFQETINGIYEDADLNPTNLKNEFS
ncbi:hypothetical protein LF817_05230 [Halobacillus sp. A1]|uniref:hypothetical protein n=1 Tax=Halobacillus sp. A1 TaxID=2880262 RepID=UPI0020A6943F|nr:hypothetical protein [Halobacillus sp. A1]MCP3030738.1 hypothetical protein [Halobacillus sp. A1]